MADEATEGEDRVAGIHAEGGRQDGGVGHVEALDVPGAATGIDDVAPALAAERAATRGMPAGDLDALLADEVQVQDLVDIVRRGQDQRLVRVEEDAAGAG